MNVMLALMLVLFMSRTVWEHYLQFLFLPLIYLVAMRHYLSRRAAALVFVALVSCALQNLIFISWVRAQGVTSPPWLLTIALVKSTPLMMMLVFLVRYPHEWFATYRDRGWTDAAPRPAPALRTA
jgi:hypothetical protein